MEESEKAIFAAGCFWGIEYYFQKAKGVLSTAVGFTGGDTVNPTYQDVCSGKTGHAEAVEVVFNQAITSFETLVKHFFEIHNPALVKKESNKRSQYRSSIFYCNEEQKMIAEKLVEILKGKNYEVGTEIAKAGIFYKAEEYHQSFYNKQGKDDYGYRYKEKF
ncbi:MAG: peptide-methionine (S)-S-oxide reductase MsrA [Chitinophagaceae bacterium]